PRSRSLGRVEQDLRPVQAGIVDLSQRHLDHPLDRREPVELEGREVQRVDRPEVVAVPRLVVHPGELRHLARHRIRRGALAAGTPVGGVVVVRVDVVDVVGEGDDGLVRRGRLA
ncbi:MAG: hypothetical protein ACK559_07635, partial [bacterium]